MHLTTEPLTYEDRDELLLLPRGNAHRQRKALTAMVDPDNPGNAYWHLGNDAMVRLEQLVYRAGFIIVWQRSWTVPYWPVAIRERVLPEYRPVIAAAVEQCLPPWWIDELLTRPALLAVLAASPGLLELADATNPDLGAFAAIVDVAGYSLT